MLLGIHVDAGDGELRVGVAALAREVRPAALELLVSTVIQDRAAGEPGLLERRRERRVALRFPGQGEIERANAYRLAGGDRESRVPALLGELELGRDAGLVVAERLQGVANPGGCAAIELLDTPAGRVAGFVVEVEIGEDVRYDGLVDAADLDVGGRSGRHEQQRRDRRAALPWAYRAAVLRACRAARGPAGRSLGSGCVRAVQGSGSKKGLPSLSEVYCGARR